VLLKGNESEAMIKKILLHSTPRWLQSKLGRAGDFFRRENGDFAVLFPSFQESLRVLKRKGWQPARCIDVGAYQGGWARHVLAIFPDAKILMIEGQDAKRPALQETVADSGGRASYEIVLLGSQDGEEVEFVEMETGSSVFEEDSNFARRKTRKKLVRLDTLLQSQPDFRSAQLLKLDTQGYELEILRGAPELLKHVEVLLLEVSLLPVNRGAPLVDEVMAFMAAHGFRLFDVCSQTRRKDGVLWQTDLMFVARGADLRIETGLSRDNWP